MMNVYLIQRGNFMSSDYFSKDRKGIDKILTFQYMGSAEFEWGSLPESLKNIRENIKKYAYEDYKIEDKDVTIFCLKEQIAEVKEILLKLAKDEIRLKEFSYFNGFVYPDPDKQWMSKTDFWWDIRNNYMFWKKDENFEKSFKELISKKV